MSKTNEITSYSDAVKHLKEAILKSRYAAAKLVNKEMLLLYYFVGKYVSVNSRNKNWGLGAIESISAMLQQELNGLRGFSATNLKNMRIFYEEWSEIESLLLKNSSVMLFDFMVTENRQMVSDELEYSNRQMDSDDLEEKFFRLGFSQHMAILQAIKGVETRFFYLQKCANEFWNYETLKHHLKNQLHKQVGKLSHNFEQTLPEEYFKQKALMSFKDEMLLDFINIQDTDEEPDERILEQEIVLNIKKFIMALGIDFSFIGNQFRLMIEEEEYFIDLLFFNRKLQSLVAIELKKGKFKAEYAGKMNLYLSALDEYVKQPHENPSIGIIMCKEKNNKVVEFAFRDTSKPMGVVTYKTYKELPENYKKLLPNFDQLKELL
jgi:predicted nuclease of restriction endonuclease-like (RecB) superfamily